jgi:Raf kinase inhibitor-like YbhB/YbcL family protein
MRSFVLTAFALVLTSPTLGAQRATGLRVTSSDIAAAGVIDARFTCSGADISPHLAWRGAPSGTKSFAVTVYDSDALSGSGWWHWVVYNIPASATELPTGAGATNGTALPAGAVQGRTDFETAGYGGPCAPPGPLHRYQFTVLALRVEKLEVPAEATPAQIRDDIRKHMIASATLTARFARK